MNTKPLYQSPNLDANQKRYGLDGCICCAKPIKDLDSAFYVHMNTNWEAVNPTILEEDCELMTGYESQGCFPVGADCAKKMTGFAYKLTTH